MLALTRSYHAYRAFSLIEAAIILALVGIVIGGIWIAAATVSRNRMYAAAVQDTLTLVENIRALYPLSVVQSGGSIMEVSADEALSNIITKGTTSFKWSAPDQTLTYPFGDQAIYGSNNGIFSVFVQSAISVNFYTLDSQRSCINIATAINSRVKPPNLNGFSIYDGSSYTVFSTLPASNAAIKAACSGEERDISFGFSR